MKLNQDVTTHHQMSHREVIQSA